MEKVFFILGRNPKLSRAEILAYLEARSRPHKETLFEKNILILEFNDDERINIEEFGGIIQLGKVEFEGTDNELKNYFENNELIPSDKFSFATFGNLDSQVLKDKFKSDKRRASLKIGKRQIKFQDGKKLSLPKAEYALLFHESNEKIYFGLTTQKTDSKAIEKRDMGKPVRRESLAISPRLSKILINLSGAKPRDLLLDPFCGIGSILIEALLKNINVHGIDITKEATLDAQKNIKWLKENYEITAKSNVENLDSKKTPDLQFCAIATETPLGKVLKKKPSDNQAKYIIQNFESLIIPILSRIKKVKKPSAKIAITFPKIRTFSPDAKKIARKVGLKIVLEPIEESRPDQHIQRNILVFK